MAKKVPFVLIKVQYCSSKHGTIPAELKTNESKALMMICKSLNTSTFKIECKIVKDSDARENEAYGEITAHIKGANSSTLEKIITALTKKYKKFAKDEEYCLKAGYKSGYERNGDVIKARVFLIGHCVDIEEV